MTNKIALITYDYPHRKTQDTLFGLQGEKVTIIALPWEERKHHRPIYQHRPEAMWPIYPGALAENFGCNFTKCTVQGLYPVLREGKYDHILIGGSGILPKEIANSFKITNSHPGYLPNVRGLDALKWAIFYGQPIGVTTHYIDEHPDEGLMIERRIITPTVNDTFHGLAQRVYETEIQMLVGSLKAEPTLEPLKLAHYNRGLPNQRMGPAYEIVMMDKFERLKMRI